MTAMFVYLLKFSNTINNANVKFKFDLYKLRPILTLRFADIMLTIPNNKNSSFSDV